MALLSKSAIEETKYHGKGHESTIILLQVDNYSDFTQICWKLQGFPIRKDSTIKDTSIWQLRF